MERNEALQALVVKLGGKIGNLFQGDAHALLMLAYKNEDLPLALRLDAAKAAIGYEKARLAQIEHAGRIDSRVESVDARDRIAHLIDSEATAISETEGPRSIN